MLYLLEVRKGLYYHYTIQGNLVIGHKKHAAHLTDEQIKADRRLCLFQREPA